MTGVWPCADIYTRNPALGITCEVVKVPHRVFLKSPAVDLTLTSDRTQPGQKITLKLLEMARRIRKKRGKAKYSLTVRWTAGHSGIKGNEKADKEAKFVAAGTPQMRGFSPSSSIASSQLTPQH